MFCFFFSFCGIKNCNSPQGKCTTFLLDLWEGEVQSQVSADIYEIQISIYSCIFFMLIKHPLHIFIVGVGGMMCVALPDNGPWRRAYPERRGISLHKCKLR